MKYWLVATYKINEIERVKSNLANQSFDYYLPKMITKKPNRNPKEEVMFPGYIFINTEVNKYSSVKHTKGIKNIIKFGENIPYMTNEEIKRITFERTILVYQNIILLLFSKFSDCASKSLYH